MSDSVKEREKEYCGRCDECGGWMVEDYRHNFSVKWTTIVLECTDCDATAKAKFNGYAVIFPSYDSAPKYGISEVELRYLDTGNSREARK